MTSSKKAPQKKQLQKSEEIESKTSGFGLKPFFFVSVGVLVLGIIAAYSLKDVPSPKRPSPIRSKVVQTQPAPAYKCPISELEAQIEHQQETISMLKKALSKQLDEVEDLKRIESERGKETRLSLQLIEALDAGKPFEKQANALKDFNPKASLLAEISNLMPAAQRGIPTIERVQKDFFDAFTLTEQSFYVNRNNTRRKNNIILFFKGLVRIRPQKVKDKNPTGVLQLYQAEDFVKKGNIAEALEIVQKFPATPQNMMNRFIKDASLYLELKKCFE